MGDPTANGSISLPGSPSRGELRFFAPGTPVGSRYEVRGTLGTGGFAVVYRAWDRTLRREVALKVLRPDRTGVETLRRFRREVAVARDVVSPRLVRIFDIEDTTETVYLTMELVEGESLRERLRRGTLPPTEAVRVAAHVLEALGALHAVGVVHRDVKPANVLLTEAGDAKLCDFGLARELESTHSVATETESVVGTLDYLSPEQALGKTVDGRADLYALGCMLFEMLAGSVPHRGRTSVGTLVAHVQETAPPVRTLAPGVPAWLEDVVARLLAKKPSARFATAAEALAALEARAAPRRLSRRAIGAAAALALAATPFAWRLAHAKPGDLRLVFDGGNVVRGLDAAGGVLWSREGVEGPGLAAVARLERGARPSVVAVLDTARDRSPKTVSVLSVLDGRTGATKRVVRLPDAAWQFPQFKARFGPKVFVDDVDEDGRDEVIVSYVQQPFWPSYSVLWEPGLDRAGIVFVGSGHHYFAAAEDLDGDGRKELLFAGMANRMGWYRGIAAVRLSPYVGEVSSRVPAFGATPDRSAISGTTAWYALVNKDTSGAAELAIDRSRRRIGWAGAHGAPLLDFEGFPVGTPSPLDSAARQEARERVYGALREAVPLVEQGHGAEALAVLGRGRESLGAAADPLLSQWFRRVKARALIAAGRDAEAEALLEPVLRDPSAAPGALLETARAYHLRGALVRALAWYRRGALLPGAELPEHSSEIADLFSGEMLVMGELGAWDDAAARLAGALEGGANTHHYLVDRAWLRWRTGGTPDLAFLGRNHAMSLPDVSAPVWLEARLAEGEAPAAVLADADAAIAEFPEPPPLLLSARSGALLRARRVPEALAAARQALAAAKAAATTETVAHAHLDVIARRAAEVARRAGDAAFEREAGRELARIEAARAPERARYAAAAKR